ncbi:hypothetical protein AVEN_182776-1 [Araneus ventricosus]|uniref:Uncharacterized protein n=1 Tax=Araneus ventricosus TaxID=182803 RepID=A0A4Y2LI03_ARAVE|nr:hypothetical protein AVEN_182776-1 [Araneus ventricosus]
MQKEEYEEWMSIDEDFPVAATLIDLEIRQAVCEQNQAIRVDDSDGDECVIENSPTNTEKMQALDILKRGVQHLSTNFKNKSLTLRKAGVPITPAAWSGSPRGFGEQGEVLEFGEWFGVLAGFEKGREFPLSLKERNIILSSLYSTGLTQEERQKHLAFFFRTKQQSQDIVNQSLYF